MTLLSQHDTLWAVVPAAGVGSRMQADRPKQYLTLNSQPVLSLTLQTLLTHPRIDGVIVALGENDPYWPQLPEATHPQIKIVTGGKERFDSVLAALDAVPSAWTLVHDAARPCLTHEDLDQLLQAGESHRDGAILGMPVRDTLKRVNASGTIETTVDRSQIWHALTPQLFATAQLRQVLRDAVQAGIQVTDEASAMEWAGYQPRMVAGRADNIKITHPGDLRLAELYLSD